MTDFTTYDHFFCKPDTVITRIPKFALALKRLHGMLEDIGDAQLEKQGLPPRTKPFFELDKRLMQDLDVQLGADFKHEIHIDTINDGVTIKHITTKFKELLRPLKTDAVEESQKPVLGTLLTILDIYVQLLTKGLEIVASAVHTKEVVINGDDYAYVLKIRNEAELLYKALSEQF